MPFRFRPSSEKTLDSGAGVIRLGIEMTDSELSTLVAMVQQARHRKGTPGFIGCRGEMEGQTGIIVYSFTDGASAAAFQMKRQIEARPLRLEILDQRPSEVREYQE